MPSQDLTLEYVQQFTTSNIYHNKGVKALRRDAKKLRDQVIYQAAQLTRQTYQLVAKDEKLENMIAEAAKHEHDEKKAHKNMEAAKKKMAKLGDLSSTQAKAIKAKDVQLKAQDAEIERLMEALELQTDVLKQAEKEIKNVQEVLEASRYEQRLAEQDTARAVLASNSIRMKADHYYRCMVQHQMSRDEAFQETAFIRGTLLSYTNLYNGLRNDFDSVCKSTWSTQQTLIKYHSKMQFESIRLSKRKSRAAGVPRLHLWEMLAKRASAKLRMVTKVLGAKDTLIAELMEKGDYQGMELREAYRQNFDLLAEKAELKQKCSDLDNKLLTVEMEESAKSRENQDLAAAVRYLEQLQHDERYYRIVLTTLATDCVPIIKGVFYEFDRMRATEMDTLEMRKTLALQADAMRNQWASAKEYEAIANTFRRNYDDALQEIHRLRSLLPEEQATSDEWLEEQFSILDLLQGRLLGAAGQRLPEDGRLIVAALARRRMQGETWEELLRKGWSRKLLAKAGFDVPEDEEGVFM